MPGRLGALWLCVGFSAIGAWIGTSESDTSPIVWLAPALVAGGLCLARRTRVGVLCAVCSACACLGCFAASLRAHEGVALEQAARRTRSCDFEARVIEQAGGLGTLLTVRAATCTGGPLPAGNVFWDPSRPQPVGTSIRGRGWITRLGDDDFARARRAAGGRALLLPETTERTPATGFWGLVARVRSEFRQVAMQRLDPRSAALLLGITVGETDRFTDHDLEVFRASGLAHVLAVSGSNVALVLGVVAGIAGRLAAPHRLVAMLIAVAAFVVLVGPDGSVLRAGVMGVVALLAAGWVRPVDARYSLPFALLVLIASRPTLVTAAGLHLSAAATLGIVLWSRPLAARLTWLPSPIAAVLGVTLAAQLAVAPLLVFLFGRVSLVAPIANVLAAPGIAFATIVGLVSAGLAPLWSHGAGQIAALSGPPLRWVLEVADRTASVPWSEAAVEPRWGWALGAAVMVAIIRTHRRTSSA